MSNASYKYAPKVWNFHSAKRKYLFQVEPLVKEELFCTYAD